jgi:hypothetical protein
MEWLRKAPATVTITVIITCGVLALALVGAFVLLTLEGADTTELRQWVNTIGTLLGFPLMGGTLLASLAAAKSSNRTEEQTNGQLTERDSKLAKYGAEVADLRAEITRLKGGGYR